MKAEIQEVIAEIPVKVLLQTVHNFTKRVQERLYRNGTQDIFKI